MRPHLTVSAFCGSINKRTCVAVLIRLAVVTSDIDVPASLEEVLGGNLALGVPSVALVLKIPNAVGDGAPGDLLLKGVLVSRKGND